MAGMMMKQTKKREREREIGDEDGGESTKEI